MVKRIAFWGLLILSGLAILGFLLGRRLSERRFSVAVVGYFDGDNLQWRNGADSIGVTVIPIRRPDLASTRLDRFDAVILRTSGWSPKDAEIPLLDDYKRRGVIVPYPTNNEWFGRFAYLPDGIDERIEDYLSIITPRNASSFLTLLKNKIRQENADVPPPEDLPTHGYFYHGPEVSETLAEFFQRKDLPPLPDDAPRVAMIGNFLNPYKTADASPVDLLIDRLAEKGIRVVPIFGFKENPTLLEDVHPDLILHFPLGRVLSENQGSELFQRLDVPVLTAISLSVSRREWESEPVGMTTSYQNLAVALPELDGVIEPTPISTLESDPNGMTFRTPLVDRIDRLTDRIDRWLTLQRKENSEKRVAIFYNQRPGKTSPTAQSMDLVPSLYNALRSMKDAGYDLGPEFPDSEEEFASILEKKGRLIGEWAPGAMEDFLREGDPERVSVEDYRQWLKKWIPERGQNELKNVWGPAPGNYGTGRTETGLFLIVSRIPFGKIVLLPQPTTAIISDAKEGSDFSSVHGTNKAPPHFYLAPYLWVRERFQADALIHFGTHGSLEFTKGKSLLLKEDDWPDALIGDLPFIYVYSVNNVGEALLAKRRTRAVLVSHKTPPMMEAGLQGDLATLDDLIERYEAMEEESVQEVLFEEIREKIGEIGEEGSIPFPAPNELSRESLEEVHRRLHQIRETQVTDGLHVFGRKWTPEEIDRTAKAIGTENAADALIESDRLEMERFLTALSGRFIPPSSGGDPLVNPDSIPTGRNITGINIDRTPDEAVFQVANRLVDDLLTDYRSCHHGEWPRRVALTLWGGEYLRTGGLTVAQGLILLGVRPIFDGRGYLREMEPIPSEELGRPRIDLVIQTSGQFRDAAASRIELLDHTIRKIATLPEEPFPNFVREDSEATISLLRQDGFTAEEAKELGTARIFGSVRALDYGTGIRRMIERSDRWETRKEIADQYLLNMGGVYRNGKVWGVPVKGLLEANLDGTDLILQSRSSNTWGPVKLDHLYEFGTLSLAVREKTGKDPDFQLTDARRPEKVRNTSLAESIREELETTLWNRRWLEGILREGGTGSEVFPEMTRNLFGWSAVGPEDLIDEKIWKTTYETIVADRYALGLRDYFDRTNPAALAETTAILLDAVRKGFWSPDEAICRELAEIHAEILSQDGPSCSYAVCGNPALREFIASHLPDKAGEDYRQALSAAIRPASDLQRVEGLELTETIKEESPSPTSERNHSVKDRPTEESLLLTRSLKLGVLLLGILLFFIGFLSPDDHF